MNSVTHMHPGQWVRDDTRQLEYTSLAPWVDLAKLLERGRFDALFLADVIATADNYRGSRDFAVREGLQIPVNDPSLLIPAMAYATENLGFAFTHSIMQEHPYNFARRASTLDHLTDGRVAWNIVTSFHENVGRNLGYGSLPSHEERYARAEEYVQVIYKLLEGSWEDNAVVRDRQRRMYADPSKVHNIDHVGKFYSVVGPHMSEPSLQRTPVLFQAGASDQGREFAARNAEAIFLAARFPEAVRSQIGDIRARARAYGRFDDDILFFQGLSFVVGGTEEEAKRKACAIDEFAGDEGYAAIMSAGLGVDLTEYPLDTPLGDFEQYSLQGIVRGLVDSIPDKTWTFADLLRYLHDQRIVGTPEQIVDGLQPWIDAGVNGFNIRFHTSPGSFADFIEGVTPVLQDRGLQQREYRPGTLREKLFDGTSGARLNERHAAARHRRTPVPR
jgi:FMN-dependent oxidoreductase (nitrilotriacetate monooxygenase family)